MREDMADSVCPQVLVNTTIDNNLFSHTSSYMNISYLFGCPVSIDDTGVIGSIFCNNNGVDHVILSYGARGPGSCKTSVILPVPDRFMAPSDLGPFVHQGFEVKWNLRVRPCTDCMQSGGQCMYSNISSLTTCACPEPPFLADSCLSDNKTRVSSSPSSVKVPLLKSVADELNGSLLTLAEALTQGFEVVFSDPFEDKCLECGRDRLDINLAAMAINKIQSHRLDELVDKSIGFETNGFVRRMITLVAELAFLCLQQESDMRPTMKEVLEILRGIQNDELNAQKPEVLDIVVDDGVLFKDHGTEPTSPEYGVTKKLYGSYMPNSSDD
ncbi:concanavalin A-like lectin/glucanase domain-containing protein [Artemisia annua]|uniref:Concanavalin A-like lectin/glucanase domain-containing protein n=1 Tax=Artemisia annua TaxID=35608 RepID=A0A2U1MH71_ARTAN|nr:concanavalin A-like lectin/glucanase domain-containing protein [Artemisia annua]